MCIRDSNSTEGRNFALEVSVLVSVLWQDQDQLTLIFKTEARAKAPKSKKNL